MAGGLVPWFNLAGIAPVYAVPESRKEWGAAPMRTLQVSAQGWARARIFSPCDP